MSLPKYADYKDSGVQWLGNVPIHWTVLSIKRLSSVQRGASPRPIDDPKYFDDDGAYSWVRIADVSASNGLLGATTQRMSDLGVNLSVKISPGELFVSIAGTVGKPCISAIKACIHDGFVYFPRLKIAPKFLYRIFEAGTCYGGLGKFGTQLNLNTDTIGSIYVALPPSDELPHILNFLDRETGKIDALIAEQEKLIALLAEKRQATISHAVTRGLNPDAPMKDSGVTWMREVPAHWEVKQLKHLAKPGTAITYGIVQAGPHFEGGVPYIKTSDMSGDCLPLDGYALTSPSIALGFERSKLAAGDIVIAIRATVGKCLPVPDKLAGANLTQGTAKVSPSDEVVSAYLLATLRGDAVQNYFDSVAKGATFKEITLDALRRTPVMLPPWEEQIEIVKFLGIAIGKLDELSSAGSVAIALLKERRSALIAAAVTGQIDVRGAALVEVAA